MIYVNENSIQMLYFCWIIHWNIFNIRRCLAGAPPAADTAPAPVGGDARINLCRSREYCGLYAMHTLCPIDLRHYRSAMRLNENVENLNETKFLFLQKNRLNQHQHQLKEVNYSIRDNGYCVCFHKWHSSCIHKNDEYF